MAGDRGTPSSKPSQAATHHDVERLRRIPVAILAGLPQEWEQHGGSPAVACTLVKPMDAEQVRALTSAVARFGLAIGAAP